jgi:hypothetical protein
VIKDESFLLWLHAGEQDVTVTMPDLSAGYDEVLRTDRLDEPSEPAGYDAGRPLRLGGRSVALLQAR